MPFSDRAFLIAATHTCNGSSQHVPSAPSLAVLRVHLALLTVLRMTLNSLNCDSYCLFIALKGKERKSIHIAPLWPRRYTQSAQAWITQFYLQITPCLPFLCERSPDGTTTETDAADIQLQLLLIYRPWKDERLSWPSWLTYSGWFTT